ncbi:ly6/PLAUR domain-containing protein 1-like isoform 3-T6 [Menidia menidia]
MRQLTFSSFVLSFFSSGLALQIQCYQCEEMMHDCSTPEFIVNCTVNVQDMCQKEVLVKDDDMNPADLLVIFKALPLRFISVEAAYCLS